MRFDVYPGASGHRAAGLKWKPKPMMSTSKPNQISVKGGVANEEFVFKRSLQPTETVNDLGIYGGEV